MIRRTARRGVLALGVLIAALVVTVPLQAAEGNSYTVTPLVSDVPGAAPIVDPNLVNAWGLTAPRPSPWWVADNGTSLSTLYNGAGTPQALVVTVGADSGPTGVVFNTLGSGFTVTNGTQSGSSRFIFDGEDGVLRGWSPTVDGDARSRRATRRVPGAIFKGLAIADAEPPLRGRLPQRARRRLRLGLDRASTGAFTDPGLPERLRAVRHPGDRRAHLRDLRQAGRGRARTRSPARAADSSTSSTRTGTCSPASPRTASSTRRGGSHSRRPTSAASAATCSSATSATARSTPTSSARTAAARTAASSERTVSKIAIDGLWALEFGNGAQRRRQERRSSSPPGPTTSRTASSGRSRRASRGDFEGAGHCGPSPSLLTRVLPRARCNA